MSLYESIRAAEAEAGRQVAEAADRRIAELVDELERVTAERPSLDSIRDRLFRAESDLAASQAEGAALGTQLTSAQVEAANLRAEVLLLRAQSEAAAEYFVLGETMPQSTTVGDRITNVGARPASRQRYSGSYTVDGSTNQDRPLVIQGVALERVLTIRSGFVDVLDCTSTLTAPGPTTDSALIDCRASGVRRVRVDRCDFDPGEEFASPWLNAVIGHHMTVTRCRARRVVDFAGSYNTHATAVDNIFAGNLMEWHAYFSDAKAGVVHPSDVRTHNDGFQHQGGSGFRMVGNRLRGYVFLKDGKTLPPDQGTVPYRHLAHQAVMIQQNLHRSTPINPVVIQNWFEGYQHGIVARTSDLDRGAGVAYMLEAWGNRFRNDDQRWYSTSSTDIYGTAGGRSYPLRLDNLVGLRRPDGSTWQPRTDHVEFLSGVGTYEDSDQVRPPRRGKVVPGRRDNFAGGKAPTGSTSS